MEIRPLTKEDLHQVLAVQEDAYPQSLLESEGCFARKLALFPENCLGVFEHGHLIGYIFTHPWVSGKVVSLDDARISMPPTADCLYIHDLAVSRSHRGRGIARALLEQTFSQAGACSFTFVGLVSVNRSEAFWERYGFRRRYTLRYGEGIRATYMLCNLSSL